MFAIYPSVVSSSARVISGHLCNALGPSTRLRLLRPGAERSCSTLAVACTGVDADQILPGRREKLEVQTTGVLNPTWGARFINHTGVSKNAQGTFAVVRGSSS